MLPQAALECNRGHYQGGTERCADWPPIEIAPIELRLIIRLRGWRRTSP